MKIYYKGGIINPEWQSKYIDICSIDEKGKVKYNSKIQYVLDDEDLGTIKDFIIEAENSNGFAIDRIDADDEINEIIKNGYDFVFDYETFQGYRKTTLYPQIIFEKVFSTDGECFAREIKTGFLFPIYDETNFDVVECYISKKSSDYSDDAYSIVAQPKINMVGVLRSEASVIVGGIATISDVESYTSNEKRIEELYKKNAFGKEVVIKEQENTPIDKLTNIIQDINYMISLLSSIDNELGDYFKDYFDKLLESYGNLELNSIVNYDTLVNFYEEVYFNYMFSRKRKNVFSKLASMKDNISFSEMCNLFNIYLKFKDKLNLKEQKDIMNSFCVLLVIKIHDGEIDESEYYSSIFSSLNRNILAVYSGMGNYVLDINEKDAFEVIKKNQNNKLILGK